jgi:MFS family permease
MENSIATSGKLWNRDFSLLIISQIISIFGNMVLSFALPIYILDISRSSTLYGLVLSAPYISLLLIAPIGGIIADRFRKQRIMLWLDVATTAIIVIYMVLNGIFSMAVPLIIVKLLALNAIQGLYMPAVKASLPALTPKDKLVSANAVVNVINGLSSTAGLAIAGIFYAAFGLTAILIASAICFAATSVIDLFLRIPYKKQESSGGALKTVKNDLYLAARFVTKEKPIIAKAAFAAFFAQLTLVSMLIVGIPVLIVQNLEMGMDFVGISKGFMMVGGILGGILVGALRAKLNVKNASLFLLLSCLSIFPIGIAFVFETPVMLSYIIILLSSALSLGSMMMGSIQIMAFFQRETPSELLGKVMSLIMILPFIANAIGQLAYGILFEQFENIPWAIVLVTVIISSLSALRLQKQFRMNVE